MSRILIDLSDSQVKELAVLVETEQRPRAAVIRDAIEAYIEAHKKTRGADVFGLWKSKKIDGLEFQEKLRAEW
jgi:metal-responsive CopG/Arc/MetJ family transcriptional regulator